MLVMAAENSEAADVTPNELVCSPVTTAAVEVVGVPEKGNTWLLEVVALNEGKRALGFENTVASTVEVGCGWLCEVNDPKLGTDEVDTAKGDLENAKPPSELVVVVAVAAAVVAVDRMLFTVMAGN